MDIREIIRDTDDYNFHSHTQFCDGRFTMDEMVEAAVAAGLRHWGFSPHSPLPFSGSPCNMTAGDVAAYLDEVERLRAKWGDSIKLYAGMEIDYISPDWGPAIGYFQDMRLDYRIGSVHFVPSREGPVDVDGSAESFKVKMGRYFDNDIRYVVEAFYRQSMEMVEAGGFDIIGHFDKIGLNASAFSPGIENEAWYRRLHDELLGLILEKGVLIEVNTKAREKFNRFFPDEATIGQLCGLGVRPVVNSDAHFIDKVNSGRREALGIIHKNLKICQ